ncbi:hypothetical protein BT96DRAFT_595630 [Gymnopus androsaceus JB14]|uniref:Uncharacterized protein n=1 Tax=Gymnopus androsaceus JB14 TaxID=1447944 RepID=A0A6A4GJG9_9AGAR|nr:hypothetical protein BT96DRAFT_595630 [Gymnopus androsaceus JB14]
MCSVQSAPLIQRYLVSLVKRILFIQRRCSLSSEKYFCHVPMKKLLLCNDHCLSLNSLADISDYNLSWCGNIRMSRDFRPIKSVPGIVNHCNFDVPSAATTTAYTRIDSDAELVNDIIDLK